VKNKYVLAILILAVMIIIALLISCTKENIKQPTCFRVLELCDEYNGSMNFLRTDTLWPWGINNNIFCGNELNIFKNYISKTEGCEETGYVMFRFKILD